MIFRQKEAGMPPRHTRLCLSWTMRPDPSNKPYNLKLVSVEDVISVVNVVSVADVLSVVEVAYLTLNVEVKKVGYAYV